MPFNSKTRRSDGIVHEVKVIGFTPKAVEYLRKLEIPTDQIARAAARVGVCVRCCDLPEEERLSANSSLPPGVL